MEPELTASHQTRTSHHRPSSYAPWSTVSHSASARCKIADSRDSLFCTGGRSCIEEVHSKNTRNLNQVPQKKWEEKPGSTLASDPRRSPCMIRCTTTSHATQYDCLLGCSNSIRCCVQYSLPRGRESMHAGCKTVLSWQLRSSASVCNTRSLQFRSLVRASMSGHAPAESTSRFDQAGQPNASLFAP